MKTSPAFLSPALPQYLFHLSSDHKSYKSLQIYALLELIMSAPLQS